MKNPTHALLSPNGNALVMFRCYKNGRTDAVYQGIRATSHSATLQDDLLMGHYQTPLKYLYGYLPDDIPAGCTLAERASTKGE